MFGRTPVLIPLIHETVFPNELSEVTFPPLRKQRLVARRHVLDELRHLERKIELSGDFRVALLQFKKVLLELVVAQERVVVIGGIVDDSASELRGRGSDSESQDENANQDFSFHRGALLSPSQIGRHFVIVVVG
jgi:hypothetical protein